jgi:hypothetical protein
MLKNILILGIILVVLNALDVATTLWVLKLGGYEANPIANVFIENGTIWFVKMGVSSFVAVFILFAVWKFPQLYTYGKNALIVLNVFYITPFLWNMFGVLVLEGIVKI